MKLTQETVRALLDYDPESGLFTHKNGARRGEVAGCRRSDGYVVLGVGGRNILAHRAAVLWMTGELPSEDVDHINMERSDNRWTNLRQATRSQNKGNTVAQSNSKTGVKGVSYNKKKKRYSAFIQCRGVQKYLGLFDTIGEAKEAYDNAASRIFGDFARVAAGD